MRQFKYKYENSSPESWYARESIAELNEFIINFNEKDK